ncbi:unnamed protein product [Rotaria sordida]|uniref:Uncharacterized protein n=1 Tax=Rotaria sordida TaxID=392033 RepID=A0A815LZB1_9BILA|nr:unnamed protein product [Rotaria sordida]
MYAQLFLSLTKAQLQEEFNHIQSVIPVDLLRRAKYYTQYSKEQFLLRWSTLSRLSEYGRKTIIQLIQPYYQLDQFLLFIEQNLSLLKYVENRYLTNNKNRCYT